MMGKMRFYCPLCKKFEDRRRTYFAFKYNGEVAYFCKWCDSPVLQTEKVLKAMLEDYLFWAEHNGIDAELFQ